MAKLGLAIHEFGREVSSAGMALHHANRPNGTIYVGVTNDLARRAWEHRTGATPGFTKRYGLKRLVYAEPHETVPSAIMREKNVKSWPRAWRVRLINGVNPNSDDLYETILQ